MLVLSRKKNESVILAGVIEVKILDIKGETVRLGFDAPDDIDILRKELIKRDEDNKR